jgi:hypothetical protein
MKIDAQLLVWLKGTDLFASTAYLTLVDKMGFADRLAGIKRFDFFRLAIDTAGSPAAETADPTAIVASLKGVLDRQSTFYNRNKHAYSLECHWGEMRRLEGLAREDVRARWMGEISKTLQNQQVADFDGKNPPGRVIFNEFKGFLAEVVVEDEDPSARESIAAKLQSGLGGIGVSCKNRATLWWLALRAQSHQEADALAKEIAVTTRRDSGLLINPNYQSAEFLSVREF